MKYTRNGNAMSRLLKRLLVAVVLLASFSGRLAAQSDPAYVIYTGSNYLAHHWDEGTSSWVLQGVHNFSPECVWYSPNTNNYYFIDENDGNARRYLYATHESGVALTTLKYSEVFTALGEPDLGTLPNVETWFTSYLSEIMGNVYFYNWDHGLAHGHQISNEGCSPHRQSDDGTQCWICYWVMYDGATWRMSTDDSYNPVSHAAEFRRIRINEHEPTISSSMGGAPSNLADFSLNYTYNNSRLIDFPVTNYSYQEIPAYTTYSISDVTCGAGSWTDRICDTTWTIHNYYNGADQGSNIPNVQNVYDLTVTSRAWSFEGDGAPYLSFASGSDQPTSTANNPTVYYRTANTSGDKTATLRVVVTYSNGATQERTATITVISECGNPLQAAAPAVNYEDVTVSWINTHADNYMVYWSADGISWNNSGELSNATFSYDITGLQYSNTYYYYVLAKCSGAWGAAPASTSPLYYSFTTKAEPNLLVYGAIFGGGRMADVDGKTEVVIINCDSVSAVYGGNDIAGAVNGNAGSSIILGVNSGDAYDSYGTTTATVNVGSVYGGGNGYYAYNGTSFVAASDSKTSETVAASASVMAMNPDYSVGSAVWTNAASSKTLEFPTIKKTAITVVNDYVLADSLFGGAKNAFVSNASGDNTLITVNGGTVYSVFGGNNCGGTLGSGNQHIVVNNTKTDLTAVALENSYTTGFGRDFGIRYLFGGGNLVKGTNVLVDVLGGQTDTLFGGGNRADVDVVNINVNCAVSTTQTDYTLWGKTISKAIYNYTGTDYTIDYNYTWDGTGVYNVRTLFGGNNAMTMDKVPTITLTAGHVGTVYGGGNAGDMRYPYLAADVASPATTTIDGNTVTYSTHVVMNSPNILVDYLYGGCQKSNVLYSTWVELKNGRVGTVYGGCNISGDVGSKRRNTSLSPGLPGYENVQGATWVVATGGYVYKDLFGGSNGFYHCNDDAWHALYKAGVNYDDPEELYIGIPIPTHNETHVYITKDAGTYATVYGDVYAGGNLANVGFQNQYPNYTNTLPGGDPRKLYPILSGQAYLNMDGGIVNGNVYGGGNMASVFGINHILVSGGTIFGALYGGNDRTGTVASMTNLNLDGQLASDGNTKLNGIKTYVKVTGNPYIGTVYGGGNGDYDYTSNSDVPYCDIPVKPIQNSTFVDINITGGDTTGICHHDIAYAGAGFIGTVFGGGDGVTVEGSPALTGSAITVLYNATTTHATIDNVGVIYGGNNKGVLTGVPEIILLNGRVGTVYGGCNQGDMLGQRRVTWRGAEFDDAGSFVRLRRKYKAVGAAGDSVVVNAVVSDAVYGGCRLSNVQNNSFVLVEGGDHSDVRIFGGNDIGGTVQGTSRVLMLDGTVKEIYGAGNGDYVYHANGTIFDKAGHQVAVGDMGRPISVDAKVDLTGGHCLSNVYAGGLAGDCGDSRLLVEGDAKIDGSLFGGGRGDVDNIGICESQAPHLGNVRADVSPSSTGTASVELKSMNAASKATHVYGGGHNGDCYNTNVTLFDGFNYRFNAIYGGCFASNIEGTSTVTLNGTNDGTHLTADTVYGGNNYSGKVQNTVLTINDGRYLHVFGAGNGDYYYNKDLAQRGFGTYTDGANESLYPGLGTFTPNPGLCFDTVPYSMDVEVNFNGGYYVSTVYGGGNMGLVGDREMLESQMTSSTAATRNEHIGHITVNIHAPAEFGRHVFAGARGVPKMSKRFFGLKDFNAGAGTGRNIDDSGDIGAQLVYAEKIVNMDGGIIHFSLYGGSEAVDDGFPYECIGKSSIDYYGGNRLTTAARGDHNSTLRPAAILNVIGGEVRKSVYGGGYQGNIFGSLYVNIGEDAINDSPVWTKDYGGTSFAAFKPSITSGATPGLLTKSVDQPVSLEASVYNGSDWGEADDKAYFNTRGVYGGETNILIDGHGYSTYHEDSPGLPGMNIAYSVIGAGTSTEGGDVNRLITIRNYGNYYECGSNSKGLFSIQRADKVILDHVYINLSGEQDAFSAYASPNYAFARIDTLIFYDDNVISVEAPSIYIANLVSMQDGGDVRTIDDPDAHLYTVVEQNGHLNDFEHPRLSDDMLDNLVGECTDAATEEQRLSACSTVDFCSKLPYTRGTSGKPMAINTLVMRNGSYMRISPFVDEFQNEHPSVHTPDGKDDPGDHYGHVKGWMYLVSQDTTQSYVYAADKNLPSLNATDGGFVSLCWCENINYDGTATKELIYHRVPAQGYRTWRVGTLQGSRTRHITLVANVDPDNVLNFNLPSGPYNVTNSDNQGATSGTLTLAADHNFAFATATMELPPADGGNFYVINEVNIDQDNGNQMQLTDQGYDAALNGIFQFPDGARALDLTSISDPDDPDLRNYRFGLTFSTKHSESNFDPACWVGTTGAIDHVTLPSERQFYQMVDHDGDPLTPEVRQDFSCWPTSIISAVGTGWSQTGGFISLPVDEGHGVVPTLQFTLTYDKRLTTTITRDVVFTMDEYTSDGTYVGPVYVTVTISTVIKNFSDLEAPVLAMYNEGITNEYVRKVTIPASFLQRDLYLRGIEWHNAIPDADFTSSTTPVANMGSGDDVNNYFFLQDTNTAIGKTTISDASRVDNGSTYAGNNLFSLIISPTESTSENLNNHLGWYNIETTNIDVYGTAVDDYRNTNSITGSWEFGDGSVGDADDVRTYNYRRRYDSHNYTDVTNPYSATGCTHPGAVPVYGESGHETETISEFEARMNTYNAAMAAYKACLQATQWYAYDSWRYGVANPYTKPVMGETGHETETESEYNTRLAASLWYAWERSGTEKQQTGLNNEGILLGTLDGRSTAGIDVTLRFNGDYVYHDYYQQELATVTLHLYWKNNKHVLTEAERLAGKTDEGFIDLVVHVRTRESGDTIYVAPNPTLTRTPEGFANPVTVASWRSQKPVGTILDASISQKMEIKNHPDAYMTNMKDAMLIFDEGDVISIMEPVPVTDGVNATTIHGQNYSIIQIIRYSGNHYTFPSLGCANRGAMFDVKNSGRLNLRNVWLNGSGCTRVKEADPNHHKYEYTNTERTSWTTSTTVAARGEGTPLVPSAVYYREDGLRVNALLYANAPMIYCHENGWVNMSSNVRMSNNINGSSDSLWNATAHNWVANDTNIRNPQVHVNPSDPNSDMLPQTHIPGGALAIVKDKTSGTQPTIVIGHNGIVYDCAVLDWNATAQNIDSREVAAGHSAIYRDASSNPRYPVLPLNYGAAVYVDGGKLQLGTSVVSSDINVTMARNFYLLDNSSSNAGVAEKTKHELGGKETSFQVYWLDTINHQAYYALNNVYLTRTTSHDPEFKPDPVRRDVQSDKITFVTNLTPESRIGVSKWFPGYRYRGNPNMPYTSVSQHRFYNIIPRDTIGIAVDGSGKQRIATLNYENGVFFNDSSYFTATGSVAEGTAHFLTDNNYTLYKGNETANPSYRDKVYVFHHTNINTRNIYLQRCASFAKGVEQVPMQYTDATGHIVNYNDYKYGDSIFFRWNPDATCIASTDTIVFKVGGGFFPYTYRWYQDSLIDEVPDEHKVKLHREQVRERVTDGTNAIASILNSEGQESLYNARMRFRARRDTLVLRSLQHQQNQVKSTYFYYVTATDKTGHCEVSSPVMVRVAKQVVSPNVTDFASKFYVDTLNFLRHRNPYAYSAGYKDDFSNHNGYYEEMAAYNGTTPSASASGSGTQADIDANWTSYAQGSGTEPGTYADRGFKANIYKADYLYYRVPVPGVDSSSFHDHSDLITLNVGGNDYRLFRNWAGDTLYPYIRKVNGNQANDTLGYIIVKQRGDGFHMYKRTKESGDQTGVVYKYNTVISHSDMEANVASNGWNPYTLLEKTGGYEITNWVPSDPATDELAPDVTADFFPKRLVPFHTHTSNPGELDNGGIRRAGYSHNDMHWFNHGYNRGTLEQRITAHAFQGRPYHDENVAILHMEYYDDEEGNVQNAELTAEFGDLYASEMVPRYLRLYQAFTVSPVLEPAQARYQPYNNGQFPNGYFRAYPNYVTDYAQAFNDKDTLALLTNVNFRYDEFCAGSILHLQPMPTSSTWQFVAWDYDVSAEEINSFVVSNNPEMNHPVAYYAPGEYWWQHVTTFPGNDHYQRDYNGDVHIKTYKGLAWLISTVNGYNGQNAHTFRFNKVYFDFAGDSVDMSTWRWTPLGNLNNPFEGEIVGNGKHIGGITCNENMVPRVGMFGYTNHATLKDFNIDYMLVKGNSYVGGIVAHADTATVIDNVEITSATVIGEQVTGGFVGKAFQATINNVKTTVDPTPEDLTDNGSLYKIDLKGNAIYAGGIVGEMTNTTGSNNSVKVTDLSLSSIYFGTLFGKSVSSNIGSKSATQSSFNNNYGQLVSYGGNRRIGGLAGYAENVELQNNYIYGNPKATDYVGGLVGYVGSNVNISNCYYVSGMTNSAWGYNTHPNSIQKSTTFKGRGKNVVLTERVDGYSNMTRALNRWVRAHGDSIYFTWRSAVDNENSGYPVFGEPDIITVHDSTHVKVCDNLEWDGLYFDQSGRYVFHVVDSADYLDSTFTLVLTVSHGDSTAVFDSVTLGEGYSGYGINLTAEQVQQLFGDDNSRDVVAIRYVDSLLTAQGCDSLVVLTLYVVNNNVGVPQVTDELRDVRVYPNPTLGVVNVEGSGLMSIEVYDNISRRVLQRKVDGNKTQFDLSNYPTGTYYVRVKTSTGAVVKKVIKK